MPIKKRKKVTRQRGSMTHGWGSKKKHRGAGNRGGRGLAGSGKRGDAKKPSIPQGYFGKKGFKKKNVKIAVKGINLFHLDQNIDDFLKKGFAKKENDSYLIDISKLGFNKVLGEGKVTKKLKITALFASKKVAEKIKTAGGEIVLKS